MPVINKFQMYKVLQLAQRLDVGANLDQEALFDARSSVINVWCTPDDHPDDTYWDQLEGQITKGAFVKEAEYVGGITWEWSNEIGTLKLYTTAYLLNDQQVLKLSGTKNRPADIEWVIKKVQWIFKTAGVNYPEMIITNEN